MNEEQQRLAMAVTSIAVLRVAVAALIASNPQRGRIVQALEEYRPAPTAPDGAYMEAALDELLLHITRFSGGGHTDGSH